jgi:hypothetical protein
MIVPSPLQLLASPKTESNYSITVIGRKFLQKTKGDAFLQILAIKAPKQPGHEWRAHCGDIKTTRREVH